MFGKLLSKGLRDEINKILNKEKSIEEDMEALEQERLERENNEKRKKEGLFLKKVKKPQLSQNLSTKQL